MTRTSSPGVYGGGISGVGDGRGGAGGGFGPAYRFCGSAAAFLSTPPLDADRYGFGEPPPMPGVIRTLDGVGLGVGSWGADGVAEGDGVAGGLGFADGGGAVGFGGVPSPAPPSPEQAPKARHRPSTAAVTAPRARMPTTPPQVTSSIRTDVRPGS
ncbi:hypothetical protein ACIGEZ_07155 [Streptomyces sp. NPDC085481]|uniref:hypothetical protein n=1 Tax=Streptomyces sp. NPDC085481 TaxID=3365727 RepID=UPI0037D37BCF